MYELPMERMDPFKNQEKKVKILLYSTLPAFPKKELLFGRSSGFVFLSFGKSSM
jgi:hypothetical protein